MARAKIIFFGILFLATACGKTPSPTDPLISLGEAGTHYVDSENGDDQNSGTQPDKAWKTLTRVNAYPLSAGMRVLFRRGQSFRGTLVAGMNPYSRSGGSRENPILFGAYGEGAKPILLPSVDKSRPEDWIREGNGIWRCASQFSNDVGNILFIDNSGVTVGTKKWSASELTSEGAFWFDVEAKRQSKVGDLKMASSVNPGSVAGRRVEIAVNLPCVALISVVGVAVEDLDLRYSGNFGVSGSECAGIRISRCDISWIGGGNNFENVKNGRNVRYGNGVQFWGNTSGALVEACRIWEIYDTGVTDQYLGNSGVVQENIIYRANLIRRCGMASFELWLRPSGSALRNIRFENNTCVDAGMGWGTQRPDPVGVHVALWRSEARAEGIVIRNNIFSGGQQGLVYVEGYFTGKWTDVKKIVSDNNCFYQTPGLSLFALGNSSGYQAYGGSQLDNYRSETGWENGSILSDPLFVNAGAGDFHLRSDSPCRNRGHFTDAFQDGDGVAVRGGQALDLGAYQSR